MTGAADVSVLVPVLNEARHLVPCLAAMRAQEFSGEIEFLFIDGGSIDGSRDILDEAARADARVHVLENPARGTPQALNIGLRRARGTYVARMDAHTIYPPDYLARGVARLEQGDVVSVSGPALAVGTDLWSRRIALALRTSLGVGGARFRRETDEEIEIDSGFTGIWTRATLLDVGGWDDEWLNDQDTELAARLRPRGPMVCLPAMGASYFARSSLRALARQYFRYGCYRVKTSLRHPDSLRRSQLLPLGLVVTATSATFPWPFRRLAKIGLAAYATALVGTAASTIRQAPWHDACWLPVVLATMHLAYGVGVFFGCFRFGIPAGAALRVVGFSRSPR